MDAATGITIGVHTTQGVMVHTRKVLGCLVLLFTLATAIVALGQSSPYLATPFDTDKSALGVNFKGHNIAAVASAIAHSPYLKNKSEFETSAEFIERYSQFRKHPLLGKLTPESEFTFVIEEQRAIGDEGYSLKYDADARVLAAKLHAYWGLEGGEQGDYLQIGSNKRHIRDYLASNAFGKKAQVSESVFHVYKLFISPHTNTTFDIDLTPEAAKAVKNDARVLVLCHLESPWYITESNHFAPEIDSPSDFTVYDHYLPAVIDEVWVFNQRTGNILKKVKVPDTTVMERGSILKINGAALILTTEQGSELAVNVEPSTRILRGVLGQTAEAIQITDLQVGDRVMMRGYAAADGSVDAKNMFVLK